MGELSCFLSQAFDISTIKIVHRQQSAGICFQFCFLFQVSLLDSCSPTKKFFNTSFSKQGILNCFNIVMIDFLQGSLLKSLQILDNINNLSLLFPFYNALKYTNLYVQLCLSQHFGRNVFLFTTLIFIYITVPST